MDLNLLKPEDFSIRTYRDNPGDTSMIRIKVTFPDNSRYTDTILYQLPHHHEDALILLMKRVLKDLKQLEYREHDTPAKGYKTSKPYRKSVAVTHAAP